MLTCVRSRDAIHWVFTYLNIVHQAIMSQFFPAAESLPWNLPTVILTPGLLLSSDVDIDKFAILCLVRFKNDSLEFGHANFNVEVCVLAANLGLQPLQWHQ